MKILKLILILFICFAVILPVLLSLGGIDVLPFSGSGATRTSGVLIRSANEGADWTSPAFSGKNIPSSIFDIAFHPQNPDIAYAGTKGSGIWKSADSGMTWAAMPDHAGVLRADSDVYKIAVSSASSSIMYAAVYQDKKGRIMKSEDSGGHFREVYFVTAARYGVFDVYADPADANTVLAATGEGFLIKSRDRGMTWAVAHNFGESIFLLAINPIFSNEMYVVAERGRLSKSFDGGRTWTDISGSFADEAREGGGWEKTGYVYQGRPTFRRVANVVNLSPLTAISFAINPHNPAQLYRGVKAGLLRSENGGFTWAAQDALLEKKDFPPRGIAFQTRAENKVFVAAGQKLAQSANSGASWNLKIIPGRIPAKKLFAHPQKQGVIFVLLGR